MPLKRSQRERKLLLFVAFIPTITHKLQFPMGVFVVRSCGTKTNRYSLHEAWWICLVLVGSKRGDNGGIFLNLCLFHECKYAREFLKIKGIWRDFSLLVLSVKFGQRLRRLAKEAEWMPESVSKAFSQSTTLFLRCLRNPWMPIVMMKDDEAKWLCWSLTSRASKKLTFVVLTKMSQNSEVVYRAT